MLPKESFLILALSQSVFAQIIPTASPTSCVAPTSRTVPSPVQSVIDQGCLYATDISVAVCHDYLAQQILTAQSYDCGNKTEAFAYCNTLSLAPDECFSFNPSPTGGTNCNQDAVNVYNSCGLNQGFFLAGVGDPLGLAQCVLYQLGLCIPEDGIGHYGAVPFQGLPSDCSIPAYEPACGIYPTSTSISSIYSTFGPGPSMTSSTYSTFGPGPSTTSQGSTSPISTPTSPASNTTYFKLVVNGNFSNFVAPDGSMTVDPSKAEVYSIQGGKLLANRGGNVQASDGVGGPEPYVLIQGRTGGLPLDTAFSLITQGVNPNSKKRQVVGLTVLTWINAAFAAPGPSARFCVFQAQVYALLQSGGPGLNFNSVCITATLSAVFVTPPLSSSTITSGTTTARSIIANSTGTFSSIATSNATFNGCPMGQTLSPLYTSTRYL